MSLVTNQPQFGIIDILTGAATGFLTGGPAGAAAGAAGALVTELSGGSDPCPYPSFYPNRQQMCERAGYYTRPTSPPPPSFPTTGIGPGVDFSPTYPAPVESCGRGGIRVGDKCIYPGDVWPGGDPFITPAGGTGPGAAPVSTNGNGARVNGGCPSGYRLNKTAYYTRSQGWVPARSKCVKVRRRNPANPRALDRALSRLDMAKRLQSKLSGYTTKKYTASGKRKGCGCK